MSQHQNGRRQLKEPTYVILPQKPKQSLPIGLMNPKPAFIDSIGELAGSGSVSSDDAVK
jgi:hypothetical protein